jgi:hypothetical protein
VNADVDDLPPSAAIAPSPKDHPMTTQPIAIQIWGMGLDYSVDPPQPSTSWTIRVASRSSSGQGSTLDGAWIGYTAISWAEVETRVRSILAEHGYTPDPATLLEAMTAAQTATQAQAEEPR